MKITLSVVNFHSKHTHGHRNRTKSHTNRNLSIHPEIPYQAKESQERGYYIEERIPLRYKAGEEPPLRRLSRERWELCDQIHREIMRDWCIEDIRRWRVREQKDVGKLGRGMKERVGNQQRHVRRRRIVEEWSEVGRKWYRVE
jgi:hypothetical protein